MKKIILLLFLSTLLSSCTYRWYREFLPDEHLSKQETYGWVFKPDVFAYKNVAGDNTPTHSNRFYLSIDAENKNKFNPELKEINVDSISITNYPSVEMKLLIITNSFYFSSINDASLMKFFSIGSKTSAGYIEIAENVDSIKISFNAKFSNGILNKYKKVTNIYSDTVCVKDTTDYEIVPIEFMMYRHESKTKIPAFFKSM